MAAHLRVSLLLAGRWWRKRKPILSIISLQQPTELPGWCTGQSKVTSYTFNYQPITPEACWEANTSFVIQQGYSKEYLATLVRSCWIDGGEAAVPGRLSGLLVLIDLSVLRRLPGARADIGDNAAVTRPSESLSHHTGHQPGRPSRAPTNYSGFSFSFSSGIRIASSTTLWTFHFGLKIKIK